MDIPIYRSLIEFKDNYLNEYWENNSGITFLKYLSLVKAKYKLEFERATDYLENALLGIQDFEFSQLMKKYNLSKENVRKLLSVHDIDSFEFGLYKKIKIKDKNGFDIPLIECFNGSPMLLINENIFYEFIGIEKEMDRYLEQELKQPILIAESILEFIQSEINKENQMLFRANKEDNLKIVESISDFSDSNISEKIIFLYKTGVLNELRKNPLFATSTNKLAEFLSAVTGENSRTLQSYLNPIINKDSSQKNNPLTKQVTVKRVELKLISMGFELKDLST